MFARIAAKRALSSSIAARQQQTVNEHGGWICKDRAEFEKYWPVIAEKQALHTAQMKAHIPVHEQGSNGVLKSKIEGPSTTLCSLSPSSTDSNVLPWNSTRGEIFTML